MLLILIGASLGVYLGFTESSLQSFAEKFILLPLIASGTAIIGGVSGAFMAFVIGIVLRPFGIREKGEYSDILTPRQSGNSWKLCFRDRECRIKSILFLYY